MPTASRTLSVPSKPGMNRPSAIAFGSGFECATSKTNEAITMPTKPTITASSLRTPRCCIARIANDPAPAMIPAQNSGIPNSR